MSEVAGKLATQAGAYTLHKHSGGRGILLGGVAGVAAAKVMVIGGGVVGTNAARIAIGMGADVAIYDRSIDRLRELEQTPRRPGRHLLRLHARRRAGHARRRPDHRRGARPRRQGAVRRSAASSSRSSSRGAVLVDVSIDQGGCFETSRATTHTDPTYEVDGIVHYCVANMPGAVPVTSTRALTNATLPYVLKLADLGVRDALRSDPGFLDGLATIGGQLTSEPVARDQGLEFTAPAEAIEGASHSGVAHGLTMATQTADPHTASSTVSGHWVFDFAQCGQRPDHLGHVGRRAARRAGRPRTRGIEHDASRLWAAPLSRVDPGPV